MTDIRKSDAQLDAEAATPVEERDLDAAIAMHRLLYQAETGILKLHARDGDDAGLGPPFNPIFAAYLDEEYGPFPWSRSLMYLRWNICRRTHTEHWQREDTGSLCYRLVSMVIRQDLAVGRAQWQLGLPDTGKTRRTLDSALLVMERRLESLLSEDKAKQTYERPAAEWMAAPHQHRALGGLHAAECPQCIRRGAAA